jgi:sortase A
MSLEKTTYQTKMKIRFVQVILNTGEFGNSAYIHLKAELSQVLIYNSWEQLLKDGNITNAKPWSWADTYPVAKISSLKHGEDIYVLNSTSGEALSFGPGHYTNTPLPANDGDSVIAGHRDTHFKFLKDVDIGDIFEVKDIKIVDSAKKTK